MKTKLVARVAIRAAAVRAAMVLASMTVCPQRAFCDLAVAWGYNGSGTVGNGTAYNNIVTPTFVSTLDNHVTSVVAGPNFSLAIQDGALYSWGSYQSGELGDGLIGTNVNRTSPSAVGSLSNGVSAIAVGLSYGFAIQNGALFGWGRNDQGEVGDGTSGAGNMRPTPIAIPSLSSGVTAIAASHYFETSYVPFSLAIQNGAVFAWGSNVYGVLGLGAAQNTSRISPAAVTSLSSGVTAIAAGSTHAMAVMNGGVYTWGSDIAGELGDSGGDDGSYSSRASPFPVPSLSSGVTAIAAGGNFSLAVKDGNVYAWGIADSVGLGADFFDNNSFSPVPALVPGLASITSVAAGERAAYALSSDGSLWVWGDTDYGDLGLGFATFGIEASPVHLLPPPGYIYTSISARGDTASATLAPIPEPATPCLLGLGAVTLFGRRRGARTTH